MSDERRHRARAEALVLGAVVAVAVLVRRPGYVVSRPYWLDEVWVASSVRASWDQLVLVTSSTPIGWSVLLRLVPPFGGPERHRLLPLAFGVAGVLPAWWIGLRLAAAEPARRRLAAGAVVGLVIALVPSTLRRPDLKQYTADILVALVVAALVVRADTDERPVRPVVLLAAVAVVAGLVSHAAAFTGAAALGALALVAVAARRWQRARAAVVAAVATASAHGVLYLLFARGGNNPKMQFYWSSRGWFVPLDDGPWQALTFAGGKTAAMLERLGFGPWPVALALVAFGICCCWRAGWRAAALYPVILAAGLVVAAALRVYPLLDERTGMFVTVLLDAYVAIGIAAVVLMLLARGVAWARVTVATVVLGATVLLLPATLSAVVAPLPDRGVASSQIAAVAARREPGDAVVADWVAQFSFGYYWPGRPEFRKEALTSQGFAATYPHDPMVVLGYGPDDAERVLAAAVATGAQRVWIVVEDTPPVRSRWQRLAARYGTVTSLGSDRPPYLLTVHR